MRLEGLHIVSSIESICYRLGVGLCLIPCPIVRDIRFGVTVDDGDVCSGTLTFDGERIFVFDSAPAVIIAGAFFIRVVFRKRAHVCFFLGT